MPNDTLPDWERVLSSAARLQRILPEAVLVGGTAPTQAEILRIKSVLILKRNATRDYLDFVALADHMGDEKMDRGAADFRPSLSPAERGIGVAAAADSARESAPL